MPSGGIPRPGIPPPPPRPTALSISRASSSWRFVCLRAVSTSSFRKPISQSMRNCLLPQIMSLVTAPGLWPHLSPPMPGSSQLGLLRIGPGFGPPPFPELQLPSPSPHRGSSFPPQAPAPLMLSSQRWPGCGCPQGEAPGIWSLIGPRAIPWPRAAPRLPGIGMSFHPEEKEVNIASHCIFFTYIYMDP